MAKASLDLIRALSERAAKVGGAYPVSMQLCEDLERRGRSDRVDTSDLAKIIMADPILAVRAISLGNNAYYARGRTTMTVSGMVTLVGLEKVAQIIRDAAKPQNFQAVYLKRALGCEALKQAVIAGIIAEQLYDLISDRRYVGYSEVARVVCALTHLPLLLTAFYKPNLYSSVFFNPSNGVVDNKGFKKAFQKSEIEFAAELAEQLTLPNEFSEYVATADIPPWNRSMRTTSDELDSRAVSGAACLGNRLAAEIVSRRGKPNLEMLILEIADKLKCDLTRLKEIVGDVPQKMVEAFNTMGVPPTKLPDYLYHYTSLVVERDGSISGSDIKWPSLNARANPYLLELRDTVNGQYVDEGVPGFPQAMSCALCSLVNALDFHRAVYLELDSPSSMLRGKFYYGHEPPIPLEGILVRVETRRTYEVSPIIKAFWEKQAVFMGEPLFEGDWPFVAIPMIRYDQVIGVVYADRLEKVKAQPLDLKEQLVLTAIAEELHQIPLMFS